MIKRRRKEFYECSKTHKRRIIREKVDETMNKIRNKINDRCIEYNPVNYEINYTESIPDTDEDNDENFSDSISNLELYDDNDFFEEINADGGYYHYCFNKNESNCELNEDPYSLDEENLKKDLRDWALESNITHKSLTRLLNLLLCYLPNSSLLPQDARTLLKTPRKSNITVIQGGEYVHFGLKNALNSMIKKLSDVGLLTDNINLSLNVDGLPLSRSSTKCFWPILICDSILKSVHLVGIYCGSGKPTIANEFLKPFVDEMKLFTNNGFLYQERRINIKLSKIICDAPAKSFILYTKGHNGYSSCSKCTITGEYVCNTTCFPYTNSERLILRTDESFRNQIDEEYHIGKTILLEIPHIGLVSAVALDYMHLICLGVMRKLLMLWIKGPLPVRIGSKACNIISENLVAMRNCMPNEFSRKPRSLTEILHWKATEYREFLLYTGPIVLKSVLRSELYEHFLSLHVAISIFTNPELITDEEFISYAEKLLHYFVESFEILYGKKYISHNVHNLLHIANEVRRYGVLDNFSAFPFENFLSSLKKLLRKPDKPLQQLANRYSEFESKFLSKTVKKIETELKYEHSYGPLLISLDLVQGHFKQYKQLRTNQFFINCDYGKSDNVVMLNNKIIVRVLNIIKSNHNEIIILGRKFKIEGNVYQKPCSSQILHTYLVTETKKISSWPIDCVLNKMVIIPKENNQFHVIPLRHKQNYF